MPDDCPAFLLVDGDAIEHLDLRRDGYREVALVHRRSRLLVRGSVEHTTASDGTTQSVLVGMVIGQLDRLAISQDARSRAASGAALGRSISALTGHFAGVVCGPDGTAVFTDHMGAIPVYETHIADLPAVRCLGTDLVDVAHLAGRLRPDEVSMREFSSRGAVTSPHTVYESISRVWPATVVTLACIGGSSHPRRDERSYWVPEGGTALSRSDLADIATTARAVMERNLEGLLSRHRRVALLFSGGEDSRVLASMTRSIRSSAQDLQAIIFLDGPNREYQLARAASRLIGIPLEMRVRNKDQSYLGLAELLRRAGPGYGVSTAHAGTMCRADEADLFIDGWTADTLLKASSLPNRQRRSGLFTLGLAKPLLRPAGETVDGLDDEVGKRQRAKYERLAAWRRAGDLDCWMDTWPVSDKPTYAFFAGTRSFLPSVSPYLFGNFVAAIAAVSEADKLNRSFFHATFGNSMGASGWVPRSGGEIPRLGARANLMAVNTIGVAFRLDESRVQRRDSDVTGGPWQTWRVRRAAAVKALSALPPDCIGHAEELAGVRGDASCPTARLERLVQVATAIDGSLIGWVRPQGEPVRVAVR